MKKGFKILIVVIVVIAMIGIIGAYMDDKKKENPTVATAAVQDPEVSVSAFQYNKDYQANEISADEKYKGKLVRITGKVESINKDFMDDPYLILSIGEDFELGVHCDLQSADEAKTLSKGQKVTLTGTGAGMVMGIPQLEKCTIVAK